MANNISSSDSVKLMLSYPFQLLSFSYGVIKDRALPVIGSTKNWWDVMLVHYGLASEKVVYFKNGQKIELTKDNMGKFKSMVELYNLPAQIKEKYELSYADGKVKVKINGKDLALDPDSAPQIITEFCYPKHSMLDVKGKDVVDIGAYVGDTPIFYLLSGAKHVYAYEPYLKVYDIAQENVKSNKLEKKISLFNEAVSGSSGNAYVDTENTSFNYVDENTNEKGNGIKVDVVSLDSLSKDFKIGHGALKIDCEGCEYNIFKGTSSDTLKRFDSIHVEYHYGYLDIVERLKKEGFTVSHTSPTYRFNRGLSSPMVMGDIIATRNSLSSGPKTKS